MNKGSAMKKAAAGAMSVALATGLIACVGCSSGNSTQYDAGSHTYHQMDSNWQLAYGWYQADTPEGFHANDLGTRFSTGDDGEEPGQLYKFDSPGQTNLNANYRAIQVRLEKGEITDTKLKTNASETAWQNDPTYDNAVKFIEAKTAYRKTGEKDINGRTWTVMEANPAADASVASERAVPAGQAKKSCKYLTKLDDKAYVVIDGYQIAADDDVMTTFLNSFQTVDSNYWDTFQQWTEEKSLSKKSAAGMW